MKTISGMQVSWGVVMCQRGSGSRCLQKYGKGKCKVDLVHSMKSYRATGGTAALIPYLNTRWG